MSPFDYLNAINFTKKDLIIDEETEKMYVPFVVNRTLSYFQDTVLIANEMNLNAFLDNKLQFDFLLKIIRKRKRFTRWTKVQKNNDVKVVKEYYGYSKDKAEQVLTLLSPEQIKTIRMRVNKGGRK